MGIVFAFSSSSLKQIFDKLSVLFNTFLVKTKIKVEIREENTSHNVAILFNVLNVVIFLCFECRYLFECCYFSLYSF